jgi:hypothetical protein
MHSPAARAHAARGQTERYKRDRRADAEVEAAPSNNAPPEGGDKKECHAASTSTPAAGVHPNEVARAARQRSADARELAKLADVPLLSDAELDALLTEPWDVWCPALTCARQIWAGDVEVQGASKRRVVSRLVEKARRHEAAERRKRAAAVRSRKRATAERAAAEAQRETELAEAG